MSKDRPNSTLNCSTGLNSTGTYTHSLIYEVCPFCGAPETELSRSDPDPERPHRYECGTGQGERGNTCLYSENRRQEAEIAALKGLVREMASTLKFSTYGSPRAIEKRSQEILNRPEVQAILKEKK